MTSYSQLAMDFLRDTENLDIQIKAFLAAKAVKKPKTVDIYNSVLRLYAASVNGLWPPTEDNINRFLATCRERGVSDATLYSYYRTLKTFCNWLYKRKRLRENPIKLVEEPPKAQPLPRSPDREIVKELIEFLEHQSKYGGWLTVRDLAIISLALDTGMRIGEIAALTLKDVDFVSRQIFVKGQKTGWDRYAKFSELCARDLARWDRVRAELAESIRFPRHELDALFVCNPKGTKQWKPISTEGMRRMLKRKLKQARLNRFRFHDLRHAYCVYSLQHGNELQNIQRQVGHRNLTTTARYLLVVDDHRGKRHDETTPRNL